ncbi:MAG: hypothetical protein EPN82_04180 [Bacteroidetes bacterium]|nr:MAG: hypothetical protein EPN82_04180 [Bacteroidota bacterium]
MKKSMKKQCKKSSCYFENWPTWARCLIGVILFLLILLASNYLTFLYLESYTYKHFSDYELNKKLLREQSKMNLIPSLESLKADKNGNYSLNEKQLDEFKSHIAFLSRKVDDAINETKKEIGNDIQRINNIIMIWIGVIGFLGIFIPILLNYQTTRNIDIEFENTKVEIGQAQEKSDEANKKLSEAKPQLDKVDALVDKFDAIEKKINAASENSENALKNFEEVDKKATSAFRKSDITEKLLLLVLPINILNIKATQWLYIGVDKLGYFIKYLLQIKDVLNKCNDFFNHEIVLLSLKQLAVNLYTSSLHFDSDKNSMKAMLEFSNYINTSIGISYDINIFRNILKELDNLIENLKKNNTKK